MAIIQNITREGESANILSRKDYASKWEYTENTSKWHFDKWRDDADSHKIFLGIRGDWQEELEKIEYNTKVSFNNYGHKGKAGLDDSIGNDFKKWGYKESLIQYERTWDVPEMFLNIAAQLKLKHPDVRIHRQVPGQMAPIHVDTFSSHPAILEDPTLDVSKLRRFIIQLSDWDWGHYWSFGNNTWTQWRAGDVAYFESRDVPHSTANAGKSIRYTMAVTGWMSDETIELVEGNYTEVSI
jgi:hypothetical protein